MSGFELSLQAEYLHQIHQAFGEASLSTLGIEDQLIEYYFEKYRRHELEDVTSLTQFLYLSGHYEKVIEFSLIVMEQTSTIQRDTFPWFFVFDSIMRLEPFLEDPMKSTLIEVYKKLDLGEVLAKSPRARRLYPESEKIFEKWIAQSEGKLFFRKQELFEELKQAESEGLHRIEQEIIEKLKRLDPNDPAIDIYQKKLRERRAIEVLSNKNLFQLQVPRVTEDPVEAKEVKDLSLLLFNQSLKIANEEPSLALDLAIAFLIWEEPQYAKCLAELAPPSEVQDWLLCEIILAQRRFLELLPFLHHIEIKYASASDTFFKTSYLRALCFWGLGRRDNAIETMESLLTTRPNYRDGSTLLHQWRTI